MGHTSSLSLTVGLPVAMNMSLRYVDVIWFVLHVLQLLRQDLNNEMCVVMTSLQ